MIKNPPASAGDAGDVGSIPELGRSLEWESALHSSILAWKIPQREEPSGLQSMEPQRVDRTELTAETTLTATRLFALYWCSVYIFL